MGAAPCTSEHRAEHKLQSEQLIGRRQESAGRLHVGSMLTPSGSAVPKEDFCLAGVCRGLCHTHVEPVVPLGPQLVRTAAMHVLWRHTRSFLTSLIIIIIIIKIITRCASRVIVQFATNLPFIDLDGPAVGEVLSPELGPTQSNTAHSCCACFQTVTC